MLANHLDKDLIAQPALWRLVLFLQYDRLDVMLLPPVESEDVVFASLPLVGDTPVKALEDVIYANPLLLNDFKSVECLFETPDAMPVPPEVSPDDYDTILRRGFDIDEPGLCVSATGEASAVVVASIDPEVKGFLQRTFYNIRFEYHLASLCSYIAAINPSDSKRLYVVSRRNRMDVVALDGKKLLMLNTFEWDEIADAAYYVLAVCSILSIAPESAALFLGGDTVHIDELSATLAPFLPGISPLATPQVKYKLPSADADIPFQLAIAASAPADKPTN